MGEERRPIVFISYSWDSENHKSWVRNLAEALMENGVFTYLDQWYLKLGGDKIAFMTKILECDKVLMICTPQYVDKANSMKNGVGEEQGIIIGKKDFEQKKEEVEKELTVLEEDLNKLENERTQYSQAVDQDLYKRYIFLKERKGGRAISPVIRGICQTCHMGLPPQQFNELQKKETLLNCPNCQRMVYWDENQTED